ncbi:Interactor of HORMAD1 protein 1 [Varanus komodoensis]|nr:Interactor of HORMAD1 protein 1 [Varanus komodoensis]
MKRPNKPSSWTSVPSDCNSLSDSQFLFGSQFCPENSQSASAPLEFSIQQRQGKSSQQNSQDNESSIFAKYQSKPQLFGGDGKEKGSLNFPAGRFKGVLEQFEENKKKIKEKYDKMSDSFEKESYVEEPEISESEMEAALKAIGRNKASGVDRVLEEMRRGGAQHFIVLMCNQYPGQEATVRTGTEDFL